MLSSPLRILYVKINIYPLIIKIIQLDIITHNNYTPMYVKKQHFFAFKTVVFCYIYKALQVVFLFILTPIYIVNTLFITKNNTPKGVVFI